MRGTLVSVTTALLLTAGVATAQTQTTPTAPGTPRAPTSTMTPPAQPAPQRTVTVNPMTLEDVSKLDGTAVYGSDDKKIGDVSTALMKPDNHQIDRLVVASGGVLGVGSRKVAMPVDDFKWDAEKGAFRIAKTADDLKAMPEWKAPATTASTAAPEPSTGSSTPPAATTAPKPATGSTTTTQ